MAKTVIEEFDSMSFTNVGIQFIEGHSTTRCKVRLCWHNRG